MELPVPSNSEWNALLVEQCSRNGKLFYRVAYQILRDPAAAQDAYHDAMVKALERPAQLRDIKNLQAWLVALVTSESLLVLRRRKAEGRAMTQFAHRSAAREGSQPSNELRYAVLEAVEKLPESQRVVVALRLLEEMSGNAVKDLLGCSAASVTRKLYTGMEMLRETLEIWGHPEQK